MLSACVRVCVCVCVWGVGGGGGGGVLRLQIESVHYIVIKSDNIIRCMFENMLFYLHLLFPKKVLQDQ